MSPFPGPTVTNIALTRAATDLVETWIPDRAGASARAPEMIPVISWIFGGALHDNGKLVRTIPPGYALFSTDADSMDETYIVAVIRGRPMAFRFDLGFEARSRYVVDAVGTALTVTMSPTPPG